MSTSRSWWRHFRILIRTTFAFPELAQLLILLFFFLIKISINSLKNSKSWLNKRPQHSPTFATCFFNLEENLSFIYGNWVPMRQENFFSDDLYTLLEVSYIFNLLLKKGIFGDWRPKPAKSQNYYYSFYGWYTITGLENISFKRKILYANILRAQQLLHLGRRWIWISRSKNQRSFQLIGLNL